MKRRNLVFLKLSECKVKKVNREVSSVHEFASLIGCADFEDVENLKDVDVAELKRNLKALELPLQFQYKYCLNKF